MKSITPILLAGGHGTRLWPLSRKSYPKQFSKLIGEKSLFQQSAIRLGASDLIHFEKILTMTCVDYRFIVGEQLVDVGIDPGPILIEPEAKNTASAILAACLYTQKKDSEAILLVAPSDHVISDTVSFHKAIVKGTKAVEDGKIVTFGITPKYPETGYGYLETAENPQNEVVNINRFIEKPDISLVKKMLKQKNCLWNSGIFMFKAKDLINMFKSLEPDILLNVKKSLERGRADLGFFRLNPNEWSKCKNISIDYAIMEKSDNIVAIPYNGSWSDLGSWEAVWNEMSKDQNGNAITKHAHEIDCNNTLLRSEHSKQEIVGIGLKDIIVVSMPDAVLVAHKNKIKKVKDIVKDLKSMNIIQAEVFPKDFRPWGWFETLTIQGQFQVKKIQVNPKSALSLQSHRYRSEHWIVVEGKAKVTIDKETKFLNVGESVYIPLAASHRLENINQTPLILIEVQTGSYLGEDDIIRYEDLYSRE